ncbi:hypothetical protein [Parendozoicomonas haliclonae]|uniref:Uncharacterized protein n=1 Tax=Parendozoicomonas haliclonae TaxID=1960125 RepID=A0A1X7AKA9_9GAMM|nr:hypothetical protein [Parendozoicomonas haliclonae]SMA47722.1 hypothetical protein EHSB41UT_02527 [Parendozoicomonas haliclonae]
MKTLYNLLGAALLSVLLHAQPCAGFYTDLPVTLNSRVVAAMTGQIAVQSLGNIEGMAYRSVNPLIIGAGIGINDAIIRSVVNEVLAGPELNPAQILQIVSSNTVRAGISGILYDFLQRGGIPVNPVLYAGLYATADALVTATPSIKDVTPIITDRGAADLWDTAVLIDTYALWQGVQAMAFRAVGELVGHIIPVPYQLAGNFVTQFVLMYGMAVAYIAWHEYHLTWIQLCETDRSVCPLG